MISIITPVYNASQFLIQLAKEISNQIYSDYEWILIDDGSQDNSWEIILNLSLKSNKIKTIRQNNMGVSAARNAGLEIASGDWICFLDADDEVSPKWLSNYAETIKKYQNSIDMILQGAILKDTNNNSFELSYNEYNIFSFNKFIYHWQNNQYHIGSAWSKIIRTELIKKNKIQFDIGINNFEDWIILTKCLSHTNKNIITIPLKGYIYNHQNSTLTGKKAKPYNSATYFNISKSWYKSVLPLKKRNFAGYRIIISQISVLIMQGIKAIYRERNYSKQERLKVLNKLSEIDMSNSKLSKKDKLIYLILSLKSSYLKDMILKIVFTRS